MARVVWSKAARDDLTDIRRYIAQDSTRRAAQFTARMTSATGQLGRFPESGRTVPEGARPDIRELIVGRYRIIYHLRGTDVRIVMIRHSARLLGRHDLLERL